MRKRYYKSSIPWQELQEIKEQLKNAFKLMRKKGLIARQNFSCCGGCAGYSIASDFGEMSSEKQSKVKGCCFYHRQDTERLNEKGYTYLGYGQVSHSEKDKEDVKSPLSTKEVGDIVVTCLNEVGLNYSWNGDPNERILVGKRKEDTK